MTDPADTEADTDRTELPVNRRDVLRSTSLAALLTVSGTTASATHADDESGVQPDAADETPPLVESRESVIWYRTGDKAGREQFREAIPTADGGVTTLGIATTADDGAESWQYTWDADGGKRRATLHGQSGFDAAFGGTRTATNGYALCGGSRSRCAAQQQIYVVRTTYNGQERWSRRFHVRSSVDEQANDIVQTADGGFVVTGTSGVRAVLAKLDSTGEEQWTRTYTGGSRFEAVSVLESEDGFTIAGTQTNEDETTEFLVLRTDEKGRERWRETYAVGEDNRLAECIQTDDGFILAGTTRAEDAFTTAATFVEITFGGDVVWEKTYGTDGEEFTADGITAVENGYVAVGTRSVDVIGPQVWLNGIDESGERTWKYTFGSERAEQPYAITTLKDGHVGICGYRNPPQRHDEYDAFVAKVELPE